MTDATVLADALCEAGIVEEIDGGFYVVSDHPKQFICDAGPLRVYDEHLITDWRVAGRVLEKCGEAQLYWDDVDFGCELVTGIGLTQGKGSVDGYARLGLPRAIIEAWYAAVEGEGDGTNT